jgi:MFS family permease
VENFFLSIFKDVFAERNVFAISSSSLVFVIFLSFVTSWWPLYLLELGATEIIVGFASAINVAAQLFFLLPGGFLADRFGRKRVIVIGTLLHLIPPLIFITAKTWQQFLIGMIVSNSTMAATRSARITILAESVPPERRGASFGVQRTLVSVARVVIPFFSGILIDTLGVIETMRISFYLSLIGYTLATLIRAVLLRETLSTEMKTSHSDLGDFKKNLSILFSLHGPVLVMLIVAIVATISIQIATPFLPIYAISVISLSKTQWGMLQSVSGISAVFFSLPGGILSDRFGRRLLILLARLFSPLNTLGLVLLRDFNQMLILYLFVGIGSTGGIGTWGGPAWEALLADLVPSQNRGTVRGLMATVATLSSIPSPIIGGFLWSNLNKEAPLILSFIFGVISAMIFFFFVKEPKTKQR